MKEIQFPGLGKNVLRGGMLLLISVQGKSLMFCTKAGITRLAPRSTLRWYTNERR